MQQPLQSSSTVPVCGYVPPNSLQDAKHFAWTADALCEWPPSRTRAPRGGRWDFAIKLAVDVATQTDSNATVGLVRCAATGAAQQPPPLLDADVVAALDQSETARLVTGLAAAAGSFNFLQPRGVGRGRRPPRGTRAPPLALQDDIVIDMELPKAAALAPAPRSPSPSSGCGTAAAVAPDSGVQPEHVPSDETCLSPDAEEVPATTTASGNDEAAGIAAANSPHFVPPTVGAEDGVSNLPGSGSSLPDPRVPTSTVVPQGRTTGDWGLAAKEEANADDDDGVVAEATAALPTDASNDAVVAETKFEEDSAAAGDDRSDEPTETKGVEGQSTPSSDHHDADEAAKDGAAALPDVATVSHDAEIADVLAEAALPSEPVADEASTDVVPAIPSTSEASGAGSGSALGIPTTPGEEEDLATTTAATPAPVPLKLEIRHAASTSSMRAQLRRLSCDSYADLVRFMSRHPNYGAGRPVRVHVEYDDEDGDAVTVAGPLEWRPMLLQRAAGCAQRLRVLWEVATAAAGPRARDGGAAGCGRHLDVLSGV